MGDKYTAVWLSHTSISDYLKCPRSYYLKNIYKDRQTGHKIQIMTPSLALGQVIHELLDKLSLIPTKDRFQTSPIHLFDDLWTKVSGKLGGFFNSEEEYRFKERGQKMVTTIIDHPGPVAQLAVKIKEELPHYWLSESEGLILCGKVDWLEYLPATESVHIIDFKTSKKEEESGSLQLPIYYLLVSNSQKRPVTKASYWYLEYDKAPQEKNLAAITDSTDQILKIGRQIKLARQLDKLDCPKGRDGCLFCQPHERILRGEGELVGENYNRQDIYILPKVSSADSIDSGDSFVL